MKRCTKCGIEQPLENFYKATTTRDGLRGDCKSCFRARAKARYPQVRDQAIERAQRWQAENRERHLANQRRRRSTAEGKAKLRADYLRRKFGISLEQYAALLSAQGGVCALCGRPPIEGISLHIDHDHNTGRVRKLLCFRCNNALGDLDDDPGRLRDAAAYIEAHDPEVAADLEHIRRRVLALVGSRPN